MSRKRTQHAADSDEHLPAPKRRASAPQAAELSDPGTLLQDYANTVPLQTFQSFVLDQLCPTLNSLPARQKSNISRVISEAYATWEFVPANGEKIEFKRRGKTLEALVKALEKSCEADPYEGWEEQMEIMQDITQEILQWLPVLWRVGVEARSDTAEAHQALLGCWRTYERVITCDSE